MNVTFAAAATVVCASHSRSLLSSIHWKLCSHCRVVKSEQKNYTRQVRWKFFDIQLTNTRCCLERILEFLLGRVALHRVRCFDVDSEARSPQLLDVSRLVPRLIPFPSLCLVWNFSLVCHIKDQIMLHWKILKLSLVLFFVLFSSHLSALSCWYHTEILLTFLLPPLTRQCASIWWR